MDSPDKPVEKTRARWKPRIHLVIPALVVLVAALTVIKFFCDDTSCVLPPVRVLDKVPFIAQQDTMWCWAASAQMVLSNWQKEVTQCRQANDRLDPQDALLMDCCDELENPENERKPACRDPGRPKFENYGFTNKIASSPPLTWMQVLEEVGCKQWPYIRGTPGSGVGHMVVVYGCSQYDVDSQQAQQILRYNPQLPGGSQAWVNFEENSGGEDFYDIHPESKWKLDISKLKRVAESIQPPPPWRLTAPLTASLEEVSRVMAGTSNIFLRLAAKEQWKVLGFQTKAEAESAQLGIPMKVHYTDEAKLADYNTKKPEDLSKWLAEPTKLFFPVEVEGKVRSSLTVVRREKEKVWSAEAFGDANLAKLLTDARQSSAASNRIDLAAHFVVEVPPVRWNAYYVAHWNKEAPRELILTPILDEEFERQKLVAGQSLPSDPVFTALSAVISKLPKIPLPKAQPTLN